MGDKLRNWHNLIARFLNANFEEGRNTFSWTLHANGPSHLHSKCMHYLINSEKMIIQTCQTLETSALNFFAFYGWSFTSLRIGV